MFICANSVPSFVLYNKSKRVFLARCCSEFSDFLSSLHRGAPFLLPTTHLTSQTHLKSHHHHQNQMADYIPPHDASDPNLPEEPMPLGLVLGLTGAVFGGTILLLVVAYIVVSYKERKEKKLRERQDEETGEGASCSQWESDER